MKRFFTIVTVLSIVCTAGQAIAASSAWFETEGGRIRLVTAGDPDSSGRLLGALEIELKPGWKTYWMDPGDAGVPPQIDISASRNIAGAKFRFPAPQRFDDGYAVWAGYKDYVSLALEFDAGAAPMLNADVFLGVCEKICIPVQASFSLDPGKDNDTDDDVAVVKAAFTSLPMPSANVFQVSALRLVDQNTVSVGFVAPGSNSDAELFIASADGWYFGTPKLSRDGQTFDVPILARPESQAGPVAIDYTLVSGGDAVSGIVMIAPTITE